MCSQRGAAYLTLLEVMIAICLLLAAAGAVGLKMHDLVEQRSFRSNVNRLQLQLATLHQMAMNMQADWIGVLKKDGKQWNFEAVCLDQKKQHSSTLSFKGCTLLLDGRDQNRIEFVFYSTGEVCPKGTLLFVHSATTKLEWNLLEIVQKDAGDGIKRLGPLHPGEI